MSGDTVDMRDGDTIGAQELFARAAAAESRVQVELSVAIDDFFLPEEARLDERTRAGLAALLRGIVTAVEAEVRAQGVRLLEGRGEPELAAALGAGNDTAFERLSRSGLLRDSELLAELLGRVRLDALAAALPMQAPEDPERSSLIARFVQHHDHGLASLAMALLVAKSRRRGRPDPGQIFETDLPAELYHRLVWWTAAALRDDVGEGADILDRALADAAHRVVAGYDEGDRLEAAASRFAGSVDAKADELAQLLVEALGDRHVVLFVALMAQGLALPYATVREAVLEASGARLWVMLRAIDAPRGAIAQIGYALCEADRRRDLEAFADMLDGIAAIRQVEARHALAPLRLDPAYRAARLALVGQGR